MNERLWLKDAIDKDTEEPASFIICRKDEINNPDRKLYKIAGYLSATQLDENASNYKKFALVQINGPERILIKHRTLLNSYVKVKINVTHK